MMACVTQASYVVHFIIKSIGMYLHQPVTRQKLPFDNFPIDCTTTSDNMMIKMMIVISIIIIIIIVTNKNNSIIIKKPKKSIPGDYTDVY